MTNPVPNAAQFRIDRWLWCARFFKSRSQASAAVDGGHAHLNGGRVKSSHAVRVGDQIAVTRERETWEVRVLALPTRRGPAAEAAACYEESPASAARREAARNQRRLVGGAPPRPPSRPDKRARRELMRLQRGR